MSVTDYFNITAPSGGDDAKLFTAIINQGIDARLEGFTQSKFKARIVNRMNRLVLDFHPDELSILLRRLSELETDEADEWVDGIIAAQYGQETY